MQMETPKNYQELFSNMIVNLHKKVTLYAVILFGSRAKGNAHFYSDFDIVVIADFKLDYIERVKWVLWETPSIPVDVFCYTPKEFEHMFESFHLTAIDAIGEGVVLFGMEYIKPLKEKYDFYIKHGMKKMDCILIPPSFS